MHVVYKIIFEKRKESNIMPFMYIGSKSNVSFKNGIMYDKHGKKYYGSSCYRGYSQIVQSDSVKVEILKEFENYEDALNFEALIQTDLDVVADPRYFNKSIATSNNFTNPNFATYKHTLTGKTVRLPREHQSVLNEEYIGVTKGTILSEEDRKKRSRPGEENPFYGKTHSPETINKILTTRKNTYDEDPEKFQKIKEHLSDLASKRFAGVPLSEEHKKKIGRPGLLMLKNKDTGESIRIYKEDKEKYDKEIWANPYSLSKDKQTGSRWVTNGDENKRIKKEEPVPEGFWFGRTIENGSKEFVDSMWVTNGDKNKKLKSGELIPDGFYKGITFKNK